MKGPAGGVSVPRMSTDNNQTPDSTGVDPDRADAEALSGHPSQAEGEDAAAPGTGEDDTATGRPSQAEGEDTDRS